PNLGRKPYSTAFYLTNAVAASTPQGTIVAGGIRDGYGVAIDGHQGNMRGDINQDGTNLTLNEEGVSEVAALEGAYSAEYHGTAVISMTSKSGTNKFHGSAYWYHQDESLNATPWGASAKATFDFNTLGFALGGPIKKNKTHFFFNYEFTRSTRPSPTSFTVPTVEQRNGDF